MAWSCRLIINFKICISVFIILVSAATVYLKECEPHVHIIEGAITGKRFLTNNKTPFYGFLDIPYAQPPVGELRFQEPRRAEKWRKPLEAIANKKICIQYDPNFTDPRETEDCLVLNVYVPEEAFCIRRHRPFLPVLIWIHGGSFRSWSGAMDSFGPHYFMDQKIIVVSINYRLGPLGFLSTGDDVIPGNLGIKDQQLAIKWVSKRIRSFGGDRKRVTIMGQSAGAIAVGYHLMNPCNKGLFSGAIMHSLSPISCIAIQKYPKYAAYEMASRINKNFKKTNSTQDLLKVLQSASLKALKENSFFQMPDDKMACQRLIALTWTPTVESKKAKNPIIVGRNYERIKKGFTLEVPLLIGVNSQESIYYGTSFLGYLANLYDNNPEFMVNVNLNINEEKRPFVGWALKLIVTNSTFTSDLLSLVEFINENFFKTPTYTFAYFHSRHSQVYSYRFAYEGLMGQLNSTLPGVGHGEEINYFFQDYRNRDLTKFPKEDIITNERVVKLWSEFIKFNSYANFRDDWYIFLHFKNPLGWPIPLKIRRRRHISKISVAVGNQSTLLKRIKIVQKQNKRDPTKYTNDLLQNVTWPKFTGEELSYLNIDKNLTVINNPLKFKEWMYILERFADYKLDTF